MPPSRLLLQLADDSIIKNEQEQGPGNIVED
jgi:hypothetical protein